ncbi:hypothetical protein [Anoxybacillus sp. J5B_2022]|uniref:hypothetical protein n=1 Tax=Anoxybacillus sp. J5B_2022 TaxID=3003246 RepID=UPI00228678F9|nr:hypothetical protein [Anoxybacillus sp. J5B_2022]MCZ0756135.1 hypothetical protein [Anoxybacillus sp. J5B_2022]
MLDFNTFDAPTIEEAPKKRERNQLFLPKIYYIQVNDWIDKLSPNTFAVGQVQIIV